MPKGTIWEWDLRKASSARVTRTKEQGIRKKENRRRCKTQKQKGERVQFAEEQRKKEEKKKKKIGNLTEGTQTKKKTAVEKKKNPMNRAPAAGGPKGILRRP